LLVDAERSIQHICRQVLEKDGHKVLSARSGREAIELHEKESIDLTIFEILLPDMNGFELLRVLLEKGGHGFIIYTISSDYAHDFAAWAADAYILKSPNFTELSKVVRKLLEGQSM